MIMNKRLEVFFNDSLVGYLEQDKHGELRFAYTQHWLNQKDTFPISYSLPLREEPYTRKECQAFFGGILPEESQRRIIARNLGISVNNDFSLLTKIGGECAGALSFIQPGEKRSPVLNNYHPLKPNELAGILKELPQRPLLAGEEGVRISLAGVQDKVAVYLDEEGHIAIPLDASPSTHILKPDFGHYQGVAQNEAFCMSLAKEIGLNVAKVEIERIENIDYLLVKRYDRVRLDQPDGSTLIKRYHQEDFCQALGIRSQDKYQNEGGPSLKQCFDLVRKASSNAVIDLIQLLRIVGFNYLIGNCDAHGKNFSLLYSEKTRLSPFYDLLSTVYYEELSKNMAMKFGGEYSITRIGSKEVERLALDIGFKVADVIRVFSDQIDAVLECLEKHISKNEVEVALNVLIKGRCVGFASILKKTAS